MYDEEDYSDNDFMASAIFTLLATALRYLFYFIIIGVLVCICLLVFEFGFWLHHFFDSHIFN